MSSKFLISWYRFIHHPYQLENNSIRSQFVAWIIIEVLRDAIHESSWLVLEAVGRHDTTRLPLSFYH